MNNEAFGSFTIVDEDSKIRTIEIPSKYNLKPSIYDIMNGLKYSINPPKDLSKLSDEVRLIYNLIKESKNNNKSDDKLNQEDFTSAIKEKINDESSKYMAQRKDKKAKNKKKEEMIKEENKMEDKDLFSLQETVREIKEKGYNKVYLSGAISNIGYAEAKKQFTILTNVLKMSNIIPVHTFSYPKPYRMEKPYYIKEGLKLMIDADVVIRFNCDIPSDGADIEEDVCKVINKPHIKLSLTK